MRRLSPAAEETVSMTNVPVIRYHPHTRLRMREKGITEAQVDHALRTYHTSYPAESLPGRAFRSTVYVATIGGRDLKVYVQDGSGPLLVRTVAWRGDE